MKKLLFVFLLLPLLLAGCRGEAPAEALIGGDVTEAEVSHTVAGETVSWTVAGEELDALRTWADSLELARAAFEQGGTPGDREGGESWTVAPLQGEGPGFSYVICGPEEHWVLLEGEWYAVREPSAPPLEPPKLVDSFSYGEARACYGEGDPGVLVRGFRNTDPAPVRDRAEAVERAKLECTVDYDTVHTAYDGETDMWRVNFSLSGVVGGDQSVYLDEDGLTHMVVYGE